MFKPFASLSNKAFCFLGDSRVGGLISISAKDDILNLQEVSLVSKRTERREF